MNPEMLKALTGYFTKRAAELEKSHSFHKAMASHHTETEGHHMAHSALHKATAEGMDEDDHMKGHCTKAAGHHEAMAKCHGAMAKAHGDQAETMKSEIDTLKAFGVDFGKASGTAAPAAAAGATTTMKPEEITKCATALGVTEEVFKGMIGVETAPVTAGSGVTDMINKTTARLTEKALESLDSDPVVKSKIQEMVLAGVQAALGDKIVPTTVRGTIPSNVPGPTLVPRPGQQATINKTDVPLELQHFLREDE